VRWLLISAALAGCGPSPLPPPRILQVTPSSMLASEAVQLSVQVDAVLPFHVDYRVPSAQADDRVTLTLGGWQLEASALTGGTVTAFVPSVLAPGSYDVGIRLADGRAATLPAGFSVGAGSWPDSFELVEPILDQTAGQPFVVALRAVRAGVTDATFHGTVGLSLNHGTVEPQNTAAFDSGLVTERGVIITTPGGGMVLTASDLAGHSVSSAPFKVNP